MLYAKRSPLSSLYTVFPMIGKTESKTSNDWKTSSSPAFSIGKFTLNWLKVCSLWNTLNLSIEVHKMYNLYTFYVQPLSNFGEIRKNIFCYPVITNDLNNIVIPFGMGCAIGGCSCGMGRICLPATGKWSSQ